MIKLKVVIVSIVLAIFFFSCTPTDQSESKQLNESESIDRASEKMDELLKVALEAEKIPRSEEAGGDIMWATKRSSEGDLLFDWTLGFFPGSCWYLYEMTGEEKWKQAAAFFQSQFKDLKSNTKSHDLGFVFYCSYGNGYRLTKNEEYKEVLIDAGNSLLTRFNNKVGCIQSWNVDAGWQAERGWMFPVIIDNMMNLEMLFELTEITGDLKYREVAISHADKTLQNHYRSDFSSYHVIDYDPKTGEVRNKQTAQGFAHESSWARGQAWGLYGYIVCYRYTKDPKYLNQAIHIADFILNHPNLPEDGIPIWDYDATGVSDQLRDASAATITASALVELNQYTEDNYREALDKILTSLSSQKYSIPFGDSSKYILQHSVGSIPHGAEIDEPLVYADYYYLEALKRASENNRLKNESSKLEANLKLNK